MKTPRIGSSVHFFPGNGWEGPYHAVVVGLWHGGADLFVVTPTTTSHARFVQQSENGMLDEGKPFWRWPKEYVDG